MYGVLYTTSYISILQLYHDNTADRNRRETIQ